MAFMSAPDIDLVHFCYTQSAFPGDTWQALPILFCFSAVWTAKSFKQYLATCHDFTQYSSMLGNPRQNCSSSKGGDCRLSKLE